MSFSSVMYSWHHRCLCVFLLFPAAVFFSSDLSCHCHSAPAAPKMCADQNCIVIVVWCDFYLSCKKCKSWSKTDCVWIFFEELYSSFSEQITSKLFSSFHPAVGRDLKTETEGSAEWGS